MRNFRFMSLLIGVVFVSAACNTTAIRFRKAKLLDATMDPAKTTTAAESQNTEPFGWHERAATGSASSFGSSCPTCGT